MDDIIRDHPDGIFTTPNQSDRQEIIPQDLNDYPYVTEDGDKVSIFSEDGFEIQRRMARFLRTSSSLGVLVHLPHLQTLFMRDEDEDDLILEEQGQGDGQNETASYTVYPQAGLKSAGHFQANGLMAGCYKLVDSVNSQLARSSSVTDNESDSDSEMDWQERVRRVVVGVASQGYNAVMHHTRGRTAQHHDAQLGLITSALAGEWARNERGKQQAHKLAQKCEHRLPHESFSEKIRNTEIVRDLRLENVYTINVQELVVRFQNGRLVFYIYIYIE